MIGLLQTAEAGNAAIIYLDYLERYQQLRLLRRTDDQFSDQDDPAATLVLELSQLLPDVHTVMHADTGLENGQRYWYALYADEGAGWLLTHAPMAVDVEPQYAAEDRPDAYDLVTERLRAGMKVEVERNPALGDGNGNLRVLTAPPRINNTLLPVVTVQLSQARPAPAYRGIGDSMPPDDDNDYPGMHLQHTLEVIGWSFNPEERSAIRRAIRRVLQANNRVFAAAGLRELDWSESHAEDFQSYDAPMYLANVQVTFVAPQEIVVPVQKVSDVEVEAEVDYE